jgi:hypothetical protein
MRTTDDPFPPPLPPPGERVVKAPTPFPRRPANETVAPGIVRGPDGKLHTDLPLPKNK